MGQKSISNNSDEKIRGFLRGLYNRYCPEKDGGEGSHSRKDVDEV